MGAADTATVRPGGEVAGARSGAKASGESAAWPRWLKCILAFLLLPACVGFTVGLHHHLYDLGTRLRVALWGAGSVTQWFLGGALAFALLALLLWRPVTVYVFAHELVHALATWLCLGRVANLSASAAGGQVTTSKSNTFIRLAPYAVPLYALMVAAAYLALNAWWWPMGEFRPLFAFLLGFTLAFHLGFTLWSLHHAQPDFKSDGWLFSLVVIYLANVLMLAAMLGLLYSGTARGAWETLRDVFLAGCGQSTDLYLGLYAQALKLLPRP
jgi:hypothetical protein